MQQEMLPLILQVAFICMQPVTPFAI